MYVIGLILQKLFIVKNNKQTILRLAGFVQTLILELNAREPDNETFGQEGMLNGLSIVNEYLDEDEYGIAIDHLLYMVYESDISYPSEIIEELHTIASKYNIENRYLSN